MSCGSAGARVGNETFAREYDDDDDLFVVLIGATPVAANRSRAQSSVMKQRTAEEKITSPIGRVA